MIPRPAALWLVVPPVDMRWGADGLSLYVQQVLQADPGAGNAYLFRNKRGNRIKLLIWDGTGVWLCVRRLHHGRFTWPQSSEAAWSLSEAEWRWLTSGVDWRRLQAKPSPQWQV